MLGNRGRISNEPVKGYNRGDRREKGKKQIERYAGGNQHHAIIAHLRPHPPPNILPGNRSELRWPVRTTTAISLLQRSLQRLLVPQPSMGIEFTHVVKIPKQTARTDREDRSLFDQFRTRGSSPDRRRPLQTPIQCLQASATRDDGRSANRNLHAVLDAPPQRCVCLVARLLGAHRTDGRPWRVDASTR